MVLQLNRVLMYTLFKFNFRVPSLLNVTIYIYILIYIKYKLDMTKYATKLIVMVALCVHILPSDVR